MQSDLVGLWNFDEQDGPVAWNAVASEPPFEVRGAVRQKGRFGSALCFRKAGDNAVAPALAPMEQGSVTFWLRLDAPKCGGVVLSLHDEVRVTTDLESGTRLVFFAGKNGLVPTQPLMPGQWHHVALVFGKGGLVAWVDGAIVASDPINVESITEYGPAFTHFVAMCPLPSNHVPCAIGELAIFRRRLTREDILRLGKVPLGIPSPRRDQPEPVGVSAREFIDRDDPCSGLQRAIDAVFPNGGRVSIPAGRYVLRRSLKLPSRVTLAGEGGQTILAAAPGFETRLKRDGHNHDRSIETVDASGFRMGDAVLIETTNDGGYNATHAIITEIDGSMLHLSNPLWSDYSVAGGAFIARWFPMITATYQHDILISDLTIEGRAGMEVSSKVDFTAAAIDMERSLACHITRVQIRNWLHDGICLGKGSWHRVTDCFVRDCLGHGYHGGNRMRKCLWLNNIAIHNGQDGFYFCQGVEDNIVANNLFANNVGHGIGGLGDLNDVRNLVTSNQCIENGKAGIHLTGGIDNVVTNNLCRANSVSEKGRWAGIHISKPTKNAVVTGNRCLDDPNESTQRMGVHEEQGCESNVVRDNV